MKAVNSSKTRIYYYTVSREVPCVSEPFCLEHSGFWDESATLYNVILQWKKEPQHMQLRIIKIQNNKYFQRSTNRLKQI